MSALSFSAQPASVRSKISARGKSKVWYVRKHFVSFLQVVTFKHLSFCPPQSSPTACLFTLPSVKSFLSVHNEVRQPWGAENFSTTLAKIWLHAFKWPFLCYDEKYECFWHQHKDMFKGYQFFQPLIGIFPLLCEVVLKQFCECEQEFTFLSVYIKIFHDLYKTCEKCTSIMLEF